jgi:hypothetical protein
VWSTGQANPEHEMPWSLFHLLIDKSPRLHLQVIDQREYSQLAEVSIYEPQKYALSRLLKPNKKGNYNTRLNRFKLKLLKAVQPVLRPYPENFKHVRNARHILKPLARPQCVPCFCSA